MAPSGPPDARVRRTKPPSGKGRETRANDVGEGEREPRAATAARARRGTFRGEAAERSRPGSVPLASRRTWRRPRGGRGSPRWRRGRGDVSEPDAGGDAREVDGLALQLLAGLDALPDRLGHPRASSTPASGSTTTNSSPPKRAAMSPGRSSRPISAAEVRERAAGEMAVPVDDLLEVVEVEHERATAAGLRHRVGRLLLKWRVFPRPVRSSVIEARYAWR